MSSFGSLSQLNDAEAAPDWSPEVGQRSLKSLGVNPLDLEQVEGAPARSRGGPMGTTPAPQQPPAKNDPPPAAEASFAPPQVAWES